MQTRQGNILQSLRGIQQFLDVHADQLGAVATSGARRRLDTEIARLNEHAAAQEADKLGARGATQRFYVSRDLLRADHLAPIARIAALELPNAPALQAFRMPSTKLTAEQLYAAAVGMAEAAQVHADVFINAGMRPDFADRLRAAADAMRAPIDARKQQWGSRNGATRGLRECVSTARKVVRVLDAFVRTELRKNPSLLAGWDAVRRPPSRAVRQGPTGLPAESTASVAPGLHLIGSSVEPLERAA